MFFSVHHHFPSKKILKTSSFLVPTLPLDFLVWAALAYNRTLSQGNRYLRTGTLTAASAGIKNYNLINSNKWPTLHSEIMATNAQPTFTLTCESSPTVILVNETFMVHLWAEYEPQEGVEVSCDRNDYIWDEALQIFTGELDLEGPLGGKIRTHHSIVFEDLKFGPRAIGRTWKLEFQLFVDGEVVAQTFTEIEVSPGHSS